MPSRSVDLKVSAQNQCEIDAARNSGHTRGGKSCSTTSSLHCDSMDLFEMNAQVSSGNVLRCTAAQKIPMMRTQQPAAFGRGAWVAQHARKKEHDQLKQPQP